MRLVDFLIHLLQTQAETLQRLAAFFGEEELLQLLENAGDFSTPTPSLFSLDPQWFEQPTFLAKAPERRNCYSELEGAVQEMNLPALFEFHLWAYPYYRTLIESPVDLHAKIRRNSPQAIELLVEESLSQAKNWIKNLPIAPEISIQAERAARVPWLKFRSEILKRAGKRPIASI